MQHEQGDFMKMTQGEQDAVDVQHFPQEGEHQHKSVVGKVKDKAKKLTTKIKGVGKKKGNDDHGNDMEVDTSSSPSEDEGGEVYGTQGIREGVPLSEEVGRDAAVHGGNSKPSAGYGDDKTSPDVQHATRGMSGLSVSDTHAHEDPATPASVDRWGSKYDDPRAATGVPISSDETTKRQHEVPAAFGQESAGVSSDVSRLGGSQSRYSGSDVSEGKFPDSDQPERKYPDWTSTGTQEEKVSEAIMKPTSPGHDTTMKPVIDGVDSSGRDMISGHVVGSEGETGTERTSEGTDTAKGAALGAAGATGVAGLAGSDSGETTTGTEPTKGWMQRASAGVTSVKNAISSKLSPRAAPDATTKPEEKAWSETPRDTELGTGTTDSTTPTGTEGKTWTEKAKDVAYSAKESVMPSSTQPHDSSAVASDKPSITTRAGEAAVGLKDTVAAKLGYTNNGTEHQDPVGGEKPTGPTITERVLGAKDVVASKLGYGAAETDSKASHQDPVAGEKPTGPTITERVVGAKDVVASKLGYGAAETDSKASHDSQTGTKMFTPDEHDTALSQKITDMLSIGGGSKDSSATAGSATTTEQGKGEQGKGYVDRVTGMVGSLLGKKEGATTGATKGTTDDPNPTSKDPALSTGQ